MAKETPEHIKKYEKKAAEAENIVTHVDLTHMENYVKAAKEVLKVEKDGAEDIRQKDLSKLKKSEHQLKFADKLADLYRDSAKEYFSHAKKEAGDKWELDDHDEALLTRAVYGTTRAQLKHILAVEKDQFTPKKFMEAYKPKFMDQVEDDLKGAAGHHLKKEHIDDILKYVGIDKEVDPSMIKLEEAKGYLDVFRKQGSIAPKAIPEEHKKAKKKNK